MRLRRVFAAKGIHYLAVKFGPAWMRSIAFDEKYRSGAWNFQGDGVELPLIVSKYLRGGSLLMLGCGGASLLRDIELAACSNVLGVDLSEEAIRLASLIGRPNASFQVGDMVTFENSSFYNVILFSESLNYVPPAQQVAMLKRYSTRLKTGGAIIVTFAQAKRYMEIIERIRKNFAVIEDRTFSGSTRHLIVFN